jgi:hypothetical protein
MEFNVAISGIKCGLNIVLWYSFAFAFFKIGRLIMRHLTSCPLVVNAAFTIRSLLRLGVSPRSLHNLRYI